MRLQDPPEGIRDPLQIETGLVCQRLVLARLEGGPDSGFTEIQSWKVPYSLCSKNYIEVKHL